MKVIEMLLQGKKVYSEDKNGYYVIGKNKHLYCYFFNSDVVRKIYFTSFQFLIEEGEEYIGYNDIYECANISLDKCKYCPLHEKDI